MSKTTLKKVKARFCLFHNKKKIKIIPRIYREIKPKLLYSFLADFEAIYLNNFERFTCELHIFKESLKKDFPLVYKLIKDSDVSECRFVSVKFGNDRPEILFENNLRVKCPLHLCELYHYQKTIKSLT